MRFVTDRALRFWYLVTICLLATGTTAIAQEWFPLEPGLQWEYIQPSAPAPDYFVSIDGPTDFHGRPVIAVTSTVSAFGESNSGTSYYSQSGGELLLHGSAGTTSLGVSASDLYSSPRVRLQLPLVEGASWGGDTQVEHYEDDELVVAYTDPYTVEVGPLDETVVVPAGEFSAARITVTYVDWEELLWLVPEVGMVKWVRNWDSGGSTTYLLHSFDFSVPLATDSVGRLKTVFGH